MEPYRVAGFRCPTCPETPLRAFQNRLICDECHGMLIDDVDYVASCADLASADLQLAFSDEKSTTTACPRCERPMSSARATLTPGDTTADVLRCDRDGLWLGRDAFTAVFARISRKLGAFRGGGSPSLLISEWRARPRRRASTATPMNLFKEQRLACPSCADSELRFLGDRYACEQCAGTFVQNAALQSMVMDMSKEYWDVPPASGAAGTRACPVCTQPMVVEDIEKVPIDRCAAHGVWFDPYELTIALERASGQFEPRGVRAWLKKLFT